MIYTQYLNTYLSTLPICQSPITCMLYHASNLYKQIKQIYCMIPPFLHVFTTTKLEQPVTQATAFILRKIKNQEEYQILFLQRAFSQRDVFSGDLCLPGGHRENGQSLIQTAIRQTQEETGFILKHQQYIGTIDHHFSTRKALRKNETTNRLAVLIFYLHEQQIHDGLFTLNQKEIRAYKWVSLSVFTHGNVEDLRSWIYVNKMEEQTVLLDCPAYNIGMQRVLWGLTLMVMRKFLQSLTQNRQYKLQKLSMDYKFITQFINHCLNYQIISINTPKKTSYSSFMKDSGFETLQQLTPKL